MAHHHDTNSNLTPMEILTGHIAKRGLRMTRQRKLIAEVMMSMAGHVNTDELYNEVKKKDPNIGYATIYRTLKLLTDAGLATSANFGDGPMRFESALDRHHHDHLICTECGRIIEFENAQIEQLQHEVCSQFGFEMSDHKLEIYGRCSDREACKARLVARS